MQEISEGGAIFNAKTKFIARHEHEFKCKRKFPLTNVSKTKHLLPTSTVPILQSFSQLFFSQSPVMIRQVPRCLFRAPIPSLRSTPTRRFLSTAPPAQQSRSWKSKATRLGLAIGVIYYYNTSTLFAEEPPCSPPLTRLQSSETNDLLIAVPPPNAPSDELSLPTLESVKSNLEKPSASPTPPPESTEPETLEEREQQASQEGAFNEETGEINWDCPCLGGMAHGPCGEQFRGAFSCFVFSTADPKGMDCIENFK